MSYVVRTFDTSDNDTLVMEYRANGPLSTWFRQWIQWYQTDHADKGDKKYQSEIYEEQQAGIVHYICEIFNPMIV